MGHQRNEESVGAEYEEYKQIECAISGDGLEEVVDIVQVRDGQPARFWPISADQQHGNDKDPDSDQAGDECTQVAASERTPGTGQEKQSSKSNHLRRQDQQAEQVRIDSQGGSKDKAYPPASGMCILFEYGKEGVPGDTDQQQLQAIGACLLGIDQLQEIERIEARADKARHYSQVAPPQQEDHD